jgi:hypothetical protein
LQQESAKGFFCYCANISSKRDTTLDLYGKYFWTRQQGDSVRLSTGDPVKFEDFDLGVQGYVGKREGVTGSPQIHFEFYVVMLHGQPDRTGEGAVLGWGARPAGKIEH